MNQVSIVDSQWCCKYSDIHELETYPHLDRCCFSNEAIFGESQIRMINDYSFMKDAPLLNSESDIDYCHLHKWTILDNPAFAKVERGNIVVPGMIMTITDDGNNAELVFFHMALFCEWSKDPRSYYYVENHPSSCHFLGEHKYDWKKRPFMEIASLFQKGTKIAWMYIKNMDRRYEDRDYLQYIHIWHSY